MAGRKTGQKRRKIRNLSSQQTCFAQDVRLSIEIAGKVLLQLPDALFLETYQHLDPVRSAALITKSGSQAQSKIQLLTDSDRADIEKLAQYPPDSAGYLMDLQVRTCRACDTIETVTKNFQKQRDTTRDVFVLDIEGRLIGYLPIQELIFFPPQTLVEKIMHHNPPSINALSPRQEVTEIFEAHKTTILPVTHIDGSILGAIRNASLVQEVHTQAITTMASLGGASPEERVLSPALFAVKQRLPWLSVNLITAFLAATVVGIFEGTIAKVTALAVLLPIVAGQSGNTGAQAMAVTMRGLALREVRTRQWLRIITKELRVGFTNGILISTFTGISVYFWSQNFFLGLVITMAMIFSMIIASISGAGIPLVLSALGKDPAQSSSVILTTVTDVIGFLSFLGLATAFSALLI